jgi:hypothetical protein
MRKLTHQLDIAIRDNCIRDIKFQVTRHPNLVEQYLGHYLELCEEFNSIESCTTILDSITKNNITHIHELSMIEFQSILSRWIKEQNNEILKAIVNKNYFIESLGVYFNDLVLNFSAKQQNTELFSYCTKHVKEEAKEKVMEELFKDNNINIINYVFENHFNIAIKVKAKFKGNSIYSKLLIKHKITYF